MPTVLIVDDSKTARMMFKHWMGQLRPAFAVVEAGSGEEALVAAAQITDRPCMVMVDYNMQGLTGIELIEQLLSVFEARYLTLCTANLQDAVRNRVASLGVRYIGKPLSLGKLEALVKEMAL